MKYRIWYYICLNFYVNLEIHFEKIRELSEGVTQFYTFKIGENELTEFELFDAKEFPDHINELEITYNVIAQMQDREARIIFFKDESGAHALPRVSQDIIENNKVDYGLRLYCIFLTPTLVILGNGDIKKYINPLDCSNVAIHFKRIRSIARALDKALLNKDVNFDSNNPFEDLHLDI